MLALAAATAQLSAARPNIVLIMADDMGFEALGAYGGLSYETPRLDRMAQEGMRFTQVYLQPICTPSRNKIMTGRANRRNYISFGTLLSEEVIFAEMLRDAGYATGVVGKWQLTDDNPGWATRARTGESERARLVLGREW